MAVAMAPRSDPKVLRRRTDPRVWPILAFALQALFGFAMGKGSWFKLTRFEIYWTDRKYDAALRLQWAADHWPVLAACLAVMVLLIVWACLRRLRARWFWVGLAPVMVATWWLTHDWVRLVDSLIMGFR